MAATAPNRFTAGAEKNSADFVIFDFGFSHSYRLFKSCCYTVIRK
jgi:hypothetical protein